MPDHLDVIIVDIEAVLCMPPYALILLLIVWNRRKSQETTFHNHYYTLVISQGIADFAAIFIFFPVTCARAFKVGNRFIYSLGDYGAARFLATGAAYLLITRGIGVALITIQRFITLCKSHSWVERTVKNLPPGVIILAHWTLPFLIYSPAIVLSDSYFEDESTLFIVSTDQFQSVCFTTLRRRRLFLMYSFDRRLVFDHHHVSVLGEAYCGKLETSTVTASGGVGGTGGNQIFSDHIAIGGNLNHHRNAHSC
uniref:G-protein coupled receptors family 1 profile domain-containing protein n=1 Tax=Caenorhabditis japonica TaxID=281687 RepID=A0A8R1ILX9_CAEJA